MYFKHGRYWYVERGKWHNLSTVYKEALAEYARRTDTGGGLNEIINRAIDRDTLKPNTRAQYEICAKAIRAAFVEFEPHEVTPADIGAFLDHHRSTPAMANRMRSVLKEAFTIAVRIGLAPSNPVKDIDPFPEKRRGRYLTDQEYLAIKARLNPQMQCIMDMAYLTGQRIGDVLAIRRADIEGDTIRFEQAKTGNRVEITTEGVQEIAERAKGLRKVPSLLLFHNGRGQPYNYYAARDCWRRACTKAKVQDAQFRDIRAKSATDAADQGLDPTRLLGHADARTTKIYLRSKQTIRGQGPRVLDKPGGK